jgi:hypothetical protein
VSRSDGWPGASALAAAGAVATVRSMPDDDSKGGGWVDPAAQVASNMLTAAASGLAGTTAGAVAAAASPLVTKIFATIGQRHVAQAQRSGEAVLEAALYASDLTPEQLEAAAAESAERLLLAGSALEAGTRTVNADKLRALGRALANGIKDDALVDPEMLAVAALADMEAPHVKVLRHVAEEWPPIWSMGGRRPRGGQRPQPGQPAWSAKDLQAELPETSRVLDPVLATLLRHGLLAEVDQVGKAIQDAEQKRRDRERQNERTGATRYDPFPPKIPPVEPRWSASSFGLYVLTLLRERSTG